MSNVSTHIILKKDTHRGSDIILLLFQGRRDWLSRIKELGSIRFSRTKGSWYIPYDKTAYNTFLRLNIPFKLFSTHEEPNLKVSPDTARDSPDISAPENIESRVTDMPNTGEKASDIMSPNVKVTWNNGKFIVSIPYSSLDVKRIKKLEGAWWHSKDQNWICKDTIGNLTKIQEEWKPWSKQMFSELEAQILKYNKPCKVTLYSSPAYPEEVCVKIIGYGANHSIIKSISGRTYHKGLQVYTVPSNSKVIETILERYKDIGYTIVNRLSSYNNGKDRRQKASKLKSFLEDLEGRGYGSIARMARIMMSQGYGTKTIRSYCGSIVKLSKHYEVGIDSISSNQVQHYLNGMAELNASFSAINQVHSAVRLYHTKVVENSELDLKKLKRPKVKGSLPKFLSEGEILRLLDNIENIKHLAIVYLLYGSGLRRGELINIKLEHIYWDRSQILVVNGKGGKDRMVNLSMESKYLMEGYFHEYKPQEYLFEGKTPGKQYGASSVSRIIKNAAHRAQISKKVTPHMLRHSFATHLMDRGIALPKIQELLGHKNIKTTMIYTHVTTDSTKEVPSPLDMLKKSKRI